MDSREGHKSKDGDSNRVHNLLKQDATYLECQAALVACRAACSSYHGSIK